MSIYVAFLLFIYGLLIGSFLTAYTYRIPRGIQIKKGRSMCPRCRKKIAWYDNIPIFSYIFLRGKCRQCGNKISIRYPIIEMTTALGFVGIYYLLTQESGSSLFFKQAVFHWGSKMGAIPVIFALVITSIILGVLFIDLENKIIPDELSLSGFVLVVFGIILVSPSLLYIHLFSGLCAAVFLLFIHLITKGKGMGLGDVKLALFLGTLLGWPMTIVWLFGAFLSGAMIGCVLLIFKKISLGKQIPFGPYLILSLVITLIWGETLLNLYLLY